MPENFIGEIVGDVEDLLGVDDFQPKPGGIVDRHRKEKARREEAQREKENADEPVEEAAFKSVKTMQLAPDTFSVNIITIPAGGTAQILPLSKYRYRATITVITAASTVFLAKDQGAALNGVGFPLATGLNLTLTGRGQLWGSSVATIQVAVIAELYAPEK